MWKWIIGIVLAFVLVVAGAAVWLVKSGQLDQLRQTFDPSSKATFVRLEEARRGDLVRVVSAPGIIEPKQKVDISAQVSARIIAMPYREGRRVKQGEVIVRLDADDLKASLESARASLRSEEARLAGAKASMENMTQELGRKRELYSSKDISKSELDSAEAEYSRAESLYNQVVHSIAIAKANIDRAEKNLSYTVISAPFDGVVTSAQAEVGELVVVGTLNNPGSVIMQVADLNSMIVKAKVDETNIAPVQIGQRAKVYINAFPNRTFGGVVETIQPLRVVDKDGTAYFQAEIKLEVPDDVAVYSGMTANADIEVETFRDVIKVPSQAVVERMVEELPSDALRDATLVDRNKKWTRVVYLYQDEKAVVQPVLVGPSDLTNTVILKGLEDGKKIVAGPFKVLVSLRSDQKLTDKEETQGGKPGGDVRTASNNPEDGKGEAKPVDSKTADAKESKETKSEPKPAEARKDKGGGQQAAATQESGKN
ncbi:MAG: efflux RND transporter periplasmic adaptor subunit [Planctomycetes bacterium]|nr:efflux RND transporter periplasmic adaptor subunit [Planctomycetota bacterium]